jgi:hypothetical protein
LSAGSVRQEYSRNTFTIFNTYTTVNSSTKYFGNRQQCKVNPLLLFHGNTEHIDSGDSYRRRRRRGGEEEEEMMMMTISLYSKYILPQIH